MIFLLLNHLCFDLMCLVRTPWVFPVQLHVGHLKLGLFAGLELNKLSAESDSGSPIVGLESIWGVLWDGSGEICDEGILEEVVGGVAVDAGSGVVGRGGHGAETIGEEGGKPI